MLTLVDQDTSPLLREKAYGEPALEHGAGFSGSVCVCVCGFAAYCLCLRKSASDIYTVAPANA